MSFDVIVNDYKRSLKALLEKLSFQALLIPHNRMKIIGSIFFFLFSFLIFGIYSPSPSFAIYDPLSRSNNIFGVHVLFPDEVFEARNLINSNGGDWGYVTIPIQSNDRSLEKWQNFMDDAKKLHIIPIIRLSTTGDYFNTKVWEKPKLTDIIDFANFLNSLEWPTENRYVVIYNEVNRGDEWGGSPNPFEYAQILDFAVDTFKEENPDFFIISAGLDNAAPNLFPSYMNELDFLRAMSYETPDIFERIDGFASHSYPNPGFSQPPGTSGVRSFITESNLITTLSGKKLPVFITETGWSKDSIPIEQIADFYKESFKKDWNDKDIVAVTPFLLRAGMGPFSKFSFISPNGEASLQYESVMEIPKTKGDPKQVLNEISQNEKKAVLPSKIFKMHKNESDLLNSAKKIGIIFKWLLKI